MTTAIDRYLGAIQAKHLFLGLAVAIMLGIGVNMLGDILIGLISNPTHSAPRILIELGVSLALLAGAGVVVELGIRRPIVKKANDFAAN
jgi:hypothetical protein